MALPIAKTKPPHDRKPTSIYLWGKCEHDGKLDCKGRFRWSVTSPTLANSTGWYPNLHTNDEIHHLLTGLNYRLRHYYCFELQNNDGQSQGVVKVFWLPTLTKPKLGSPFLVTSSKRIWAGSTLHWTCYTDIDCHLWIKVGNRAPRRKKSWHYKRGVMFHHSPDIYFPWIWKIEQKEAGDTTEHTFPIYFRIVYQTKWWYAYGFTDGKESPSKSPIFHATYSGAVYIPACQAPNFVPFPSSAYTDLRQVVQVIKPTKTYITDTFTLAISKQVNLPLLQGTRLLIFDCGTQTVPPYEPIVEVPVLINPPEFPQYEIYTANFLPIQLKKDHYYAIGAGGSNVHHSHHYCARLPLATKGTCWDNFACYGRHYNVEKNKWHPWFHYWSDVYDLLYSLPEKL